MKVASRRGETVVKARVGERNVPPRGVVFVPFFDEHALINLVTFDAYSIVSIRRPSHPGGGSWLEGVAITASSRLKTRLAKFRDCL